MNFSLRKWRGPTLAVFILCVQFARVGAMTIGAVSVNSPANSLNVPLYGKIEFNVPLTTVSSKFYEADPAQDGVDVSAVFTAPNSTTTNIKGFYDGSHWLIRFAPMQTGVWQVAIMASDSGGNATATTAFTAVASTASGFAQINGSFIKFTNGSGFYAVGHNNGWQYDVEQPSFVDMAAQGENLLSFWLVTALVETY